MKFAWAVLCLGALIYACPVRADILLGVVGTEPGTPIAGEEDVVVFNLTGPADGCSTPGGTPVCTPITFNNVVLTINGTTQLNLGNVGPGMTESYPVAGGVFVDGSITSLSFSADVSSTTLTDDLGSTYNVNSSIFLTGIPVDGTLANIDGALVTATPVPEPNLAPALLSLLGLSGAVGIRRRIKKLS